MMIHINVESYLAQKFNSNVQKNMGTWKLLDAFLYMAWIPGLGQPPAETCAQTLLII